MAREDRVELAGLEIHYTELARWIVELHGLANATAQYREA